MRLYLTSVAISLAVNSNVALAGKKLKSSSTSDGTSCSAVTYADSRCETYCDTFIEKCVNTGYFSDFGNGSDGKKDCMKACEQYPRVGVANYYDYTDLVFDNGGDTMQCRELHLNWAGSSYHCGHAAPGGNYVCDNIELKGVKKTPFQAMREGSCTIRHVGSCRLSGDDTVADCSNPDPEAESYAGIDQDQFVRALSTLPSTVHTIFLYRNSGITELTGDIFMGMKNPSALKALFLNGCGITEVDQNAFNGLKNLQLLNLDLNQIGNLPENVFQHTPRLREFSFFNQNGNYNTVPPEGLFQYTPRLERLNFFANGFGALPAGLFAGLAKLESLKIVGDGLTEDTIPDSIFEDLTSLKVLDMGFNPITSIKEEWFGEWSHELEFLSFWYCEIDSELTPEMFANIPNLKTIFLMDQQNGASIPEFDIDEVFARNRNLENIDFDF
eukprot:CAMPEP_0197464370 /NCGR_PEP_ID=MMETSP1175-20131217/63987_1 /TAXON_ID=1003142 /ORGANISM="Triceratium dubium, Strain CCMP147" /LENGTH=441 /DNA_ID=CAMNT_0043000349 /DNA_START=171 /DNA_END=1496 /DNA_ORIENTATION=-